MSNGLVGSDTAANELKQLKDLALPEPISWFPHTWAWFALFAAIFCALIYVLYRWFRRYHANAYRREALQELEHIEDVLIQSNNAVSASQQLARVLKRVALVSWPRTKVARLSGDEWISFMQKHLPGKVDSGLATFIGEDEYRGELPPPKLSRWKSRIMPSARDWIRRHHV